MSVIQCLLVSKSGEIEPQQIKGMPHPDIYGDLCPWHFPYRNSHKYVKFLFIFTLYWAL